MNKNKSELIKIGIRVVQFLNLPTTNDLKTEAIFSLLNEWEKSLNLCDELFINKNLLLKAIDQSTNENNESITFGLFLGNLNQIMTLEYCAKNADHRKLKALMKTNWGLIDMDPLYSPEPIKLTEEVLSKYFSTAEDQQLLDEVFKKVG